MQTRLKLRLLQQAAAAAAPIQESTQSPPKASKEKKQMKKKKGSQSLESSVCPSVDLPATSAAGAVDDKSNVYNTEQEHINISSPAPYQQSADQSESEDETFDNSLHLEQQKLIDIYNYEDNHEKNLELDDLIVGATAAENKLIQSSNSWPIEKGDLKWTKTNRNSDCLIMGSFSYVFMSESVKKNKINFRCQRRDLKCGAVVHLELNTYSFIDTNNVNHNHPPDKMIMKQKILNHTIQQRIDSEPTAVLKVIERVYAEANLTDEEQLNIRLPKAIANTFYKRRARRYPAHPKTQIFDIGDGFNKNNRGEDFIIYDRNKEQLDGRLLMFSTPKLLSALFDSDILLSDGTFKTRPLLFQQVYVIMGRYHGETIPLVWCLTSSRTQPVYDAIWKKLKKIAKHMNKQWKMTMCMVDFERAVINSFKAAFPDINIRCCWYHFVQSLWRKCQKLGLSTAYENDPMVQIWFKQFMALPLISKGIIQDGLQLLKESIPSTDYRYYKFIKYFEKEWMQRTPIDLWNHGSGDMKTNNALEGYNFRLFNRFGLHPSIWEFLHYLKDEEALISHRITHLGGGSGITSSTLIFSHIQSKQKAKEKKKQLLHLEDLFDSGIIGVKEYLRTASSMVGKMHTQKYCGDEADGDQLTTNQNEED